MSVDYTKRVPIVSEIVSGATAGLVTYFGGKDHDYLVHGMDVHVNVAGGAATHEINIESHDGATEYASIVVGTSAAKTQFSVKVAEGSRVFTATTVLRLFTVNNSASSNYFVRVWGSPVL